MPLRSLGILPAAPPASDPPPAVSHSHRSRCGKIARLPHHIRFNLCQRLEDGHDGKSILTWLNSLREVQTILQKHFGGLPVNAVNLTYWKQGGFLDGQRVQQKRDWLLHLTEDAEDLRSAAPGAISEEIGPIIATEFAQTVREPLDSISDPELRWRRLREILPEFARLLAAP